jgi:protein gp37
MIQNTTDDRMECTVNVITDNCNRCRKGNGRADKARGRNDAPRNGSTKNGNANLGLGVRPQAKLNEKTLAQLQQWSEPRSVVVGTDLFCDCVPTPVIRRALTAMGEASQHFFRIVTSNPVRLMQMSPKLHWQPNIWVGVAVESKDHAHRTDQLRATDALVKFVSFQPLLGPAGKVDLTGIDWVVVGGDTGPSATPLKPDWVREIRDQCIAANVPFFFKGWGGWSRKADPRFLDGRTWDEMPEPPEPHDLEILAAIESDPVEPPPAPLADLPEQTVPVRIWAFLRSCPGIAVALIALMAMLMLVQGLWIDPVPLASLLKETAVMVTMATFFSLVIHYITQRPSR